MAAAKKQICMILGAVPLESGALFREFDPRTHFVICADAGYETARKYHVVPDLIVGDFDSAEKRPAEEHKTIVLPVEKDVTDTMYAVMKGLSAGFDSFLLLGCLGGPRFDHSIANLEVLQYLLAHGARGQLVDEHTRVFLMKDERLRMTGELGSTVSVFPYHGESCTVSYTGLQYPMEREALRCGDARMGVSNRIVSEDAAIRVHSGTALVIVYRA